MRRGNASFIRVNEIRVLSSLVARLNRNYLTRYQLRFTLNTQSMYIKQIMTGLEGNMQIYLPREIASPRVSIDRGEAEVNRNSWGGDPESQGANR